MSKLSVTFSDFKVFKVRTEGSEKKSIFNSKSVKTEWIPREMFEVPKLSYRAFITWRDFD